jgi:hypothetical protein
MQPKPLTNTLDFFIPSFTKRVEFPFYDVGIRAGFLRLPMIL